MKFYNQALQAALASGIAQTLPSGLVAAPLPGGGTLIAKAEPAKSPLPKMDRDILAHLAQVCRVTYSRGQTLVICETGNRKISAPLYSAEVKEIIAQRAKGKYRGEVLEAFEWLRDHSAREEVQRQAQLVLDWLEAI